MTDWGPDVLGEGFEATTTHLGDDGEGAVVATVVRHRHHGHSHPDGTGAAEGAEPGGGAVLYVHGFNDYFFQAHEARWWAGRGWDFYAVDLRKYGRSLRPHQTAGMCTSLDDYDADLDAALAVVRGDGHDRIVLAGHSTGGLTVPLWLARRPAPEVVGVALNSPFLALAQPPAAAAALMPLVRALAHRSPLRALPGGVSTYTESIHRDFAGTWDFDLAWKPIGSAIRAGWLAAVVAGQRRLHDGLDLGVPVLVLASDRMVGGPPGSEAMQSGDGVLDPGRIARWAPALGRNVTVVRVPGALHDVWLSRPEPRHLVEEATARWLDGWVSAAG